MKPDDRKKQILDAAISCFTKRGYHATSISNIIDKAKIARGTFYLYFKSKHEIFQCILDDFIFYLASQIKTIDVTAPISPATQMRNNVKRIVDTILKRPEIGQILFNEAVGLDDATQSRLKDFYSTLLTIIQSSIKKGISVGLIRNVDHRVASCVALGGIRELITQIHIFKNTKIGRKALVDGLMDVIFGGLGPNLLDR